MNEMMKALQTAREKGHVTAVYRDETGDSWSGVPVLTGPSIAVLARERDFSLDGYIAIAEKEISGVERYDDNDFIRRVMEGEKVYQNSKPPEKFRGCGDWKEILQGITEGFSGWCIAECDDGEGEICFYVGKLLALEANHFTLRPISADGRWNPDAVEILYEDLRTVAFGGNYLRVYGEYVKG